MNKTKSSSEPFDDGNHFVWYDIRPNDKRKVKRKKFIPFSIL